MPTILFPPNCASRLLFPIMTEDHENWVVQRVPVTKADAQAHARCIEQNPKFRGWAENPYTGKVNIKIDPVGLKEAVQTWVASMRPTRAH